MRVEEIYAKTPHLETLVKLTGYETVDSLVFLHNLVRELKPACVLELGTGYGCSAAFMALALEELDSGGLLLSIDDYRGDMTDDIEVVHSHLYQCDIHSRVMLMRGSTFDPLNYHFAPSELVFMDASHIALQDLVREYEAFIPSLPPNHVIVIDDLDNEAVESFSLQLELYPRYAARLILEYHHGLAVLATDNSYLPKIGIAIASGEA